METSSDGEEFSDAWANFATPLEHDCDRQNIPAERQLSQVDEEDQEASSQRKKIRLSDWINEGSELIDDHSEV